MASVVAEGLFNAIAFAGAGFLFSKLNHRGYEGEMKRHNLAMEKLVAAKEEWYERQVARKNKMARLRLELNDANKDINETNKTLEALANVTEELQEEAPKIQDYYEPSDEMKGYESAAVGVAGFGVGYVATKILKADF